MRIYFRRANVIKNICFLMAVVLLFFFSLTTLSRTVLAESLSADDLHAVNLNTVWHKIYCGGGQQTIGGNTGGKLFLLGDSVANGASKALTDALSKSFKIVDIDAVDSRTLTEGSDKTDGLTSLKNDEARFGDAGTVVIELGANSNGLTASNINKAITIIKAKNTNSKIYWVNVGSITPARYTNVNKIIQQNTTLGYNIIDWAAVVAKHQEYIDSGPNGYSVHTIGAGMQALADTINKAVGTSQQTVANTQDTSESCCAVATLLAGNDNAEKIWNFLIAKGLKPPHVAGIMGNMQAEAHFEPRLVEYGFKNSRGEVSRQGQPSSLDDNVPPDQNEKGQPGYGLVQWTGGRKQPLRDAAASKNVKAGDLSLQLDNLWRELSGPYKVRVLDPILAIPETDRDAVERATNIFLEKFEVPGNIEKTRPGRISAAIALLGQYGSVQGGTVSASTGSSTCNVSGAGSSSIAAMALKLAWPEPGHGLDPKPEYVEAIKQFNVNVAYNGADCGSFVGTVMKASGADPNYPDRQTKVQENYVKAHQDIFDISTDWNSKNDLRPGDILIANVADGQDGNGHTFIYVGPQGAKGYDKADASGKKRMPNLDLWGPDNYVHYKGAHYIRVRLKERLPAV